MSFQADAYMIEPALIPHLSIEVVGTPVPQGNLSRGRYGGIYESNPMLRSWRDTLVSELLTAKGDRDTLWGAVEVECRFFLPWLKSHYSQSKARTGELKAGAPRMPITKPDLDKLQRAVGDALTDAKVVNDDAQIVSWVVSKWYRQQSGVAIIVTEIDTSSWN